MGVFSRSRNSRFSDKKLSRASRLSLVSVLIVLVSACGSSSSVTTGNAPASGGGGVTTTAGLTNINVGCDTGFFGCTPLLIAQQKGFFAQNHLKATSVPIASTTNGEAGLISGSIDIGLAPDPFVAQEKTGVQLQAVTGLTTGYFLILANSSIQTPANATPLQLMQALKGKKIGLAGLGGVAYFMLLDALKQANMTTSDVTIVNIGAIGAPEFAALQNNSVNALVTDVVAVPRLVGQNGIHEMIDFNSPGILPSYLSGAASGLHSNTFMATKTWVQAHPQQVKEFQIALSEASVWMSQPSNFSEAESIESQLTGTTLSPAGLSYVTKDVINSVMAIYVSPASMEAQYKFDLAGNLIKPIPNVNVSDYIAPGCPATLADVNKLGAGALS